MKGILFTPAMAVAACSGVKTQTRRVINPQPKSYEGGTSMIKGQGREWSAVSLEGDDQPLTCDYVPGERRCLLTEWAVNARFNDLRPLELPETSDLGLWHAGMTKRKPLANDPPLGKSRRGRFLPNHLRPLMPQFEIVGVRAERVNEISDADVRAEGILGDSYLEDGITEREPRSALHYFRELWDSINDGKRGYGWESDPWTWRVEFRRV